MGRRLLPRIPMPASLRRVYDRLPREVKYRMKVVGGFVQTGLVVIFATLGVALLFKAFTGATVIEPRSGQQVFASVEDPSSSSYSVETVRIKQMDGDSLRIDTVRGFEVDPGAGKIQALIAGVSFLPFRLQSDGKIMVIKYEDLPPRFSTENVPSGSQIRPVYASDLEPLAGKILNNKATIDGQRGWFVAWRPDSKTLLRLLSVELPGMENADTKAIRAGKFKILGATASVLRGSKRLHQVDAFIAVNKARLQIRAVYRKQNQSNIRNLDLSTP